LERELWAVAYGEGGEARARERVSVGRREKGSLEAILS